MGYEYLLPGHSTREEEGFTGTWNPDGSHLQKREAGIYFGGGAPQVTWTKGKNPGEKSVFHAVLTYQPAQVILRRDGKKVKEAASTTIYLRCFNVPQAGDRRTDKGTHAQSADSSRFQVWLNAFGQYWSKKRKTAIRFDTKGQQEMAQAILDSGRDKSKLTLRIDHRNTASKFEAGSPQFNNAVKEHGVPIIYLLGNSLSEDYCIVYIPRPDSLRDRKGVFDDAIIQRISDVERLADTDEGWAKLTQHSKLRDDRTATAGDAETEEDEETSREAAGIDEEYTGDDEASDTIEDSYATGGDDEDDGEDW